MVICLDIDRVRQVVLDKVKYIRRTIYEDDQIVITPALGDEEIEKLILIALEELKQPIDWKSLKKIFYDIVGEDRLRECLVNLKSKGEIALLSKTRYCLPQYIPEEDMYKIKNPIIFKKIN